MADLHALDEFLRRHAGLFGGQHDRRAVHVVGGDEMHRVAGHAPRAHPDVGLDVAEQMADVQRAVRVGQGVGDEDLAGFGHATLEFCTVFQRAIMTCVRARAAGICAAGGTFTPVRCCQSPGCRDISAAAWNSFVFIGVSDEFAR